MRARRTVLAAALAAGVALSGAALAPAAGTKTVKVQGIAYTPSKITVSRGTTVVWRFADGGIPHTVTSSKFKSSRTMKSGTYKVRFTRPGKYTYRCSIHSTMRGTVIVK